MEYDFVILFSPCKFCKCFEILGIDLTRMHIMVVFHF